jgi:hypothetical protein
MRCEKCDKEIIPPDIVQTWTKDTPIKNYHIKCYYGKLRQGTKRALRPILRNGER